MPIDASAFGDTRRLRPGETVYLSRGMILEWPEDRMRRACLTRWTVRNGDPRCDCGSCKWEPTAKGT